MAFTFVERMDEVLHLALLPPVHGLADQITIESVPADSAEPRAVTPPASAG
jgi:hypothetical protein